MTITDMLGQSGVVAILGMSIVFSFLVILVFAITGTGRIIGRYSKQNEVPQQAAAQTAPVLQKPANSDEITAAISAAVNAYRKNNQK